MRLLFAFGTRIYVSSGGRQAVIDLARGVDSGDDPVTADLPGVQVQVPYPNRAVRG